MACHMAFDQAKKAPALWHRAAFARGVAQHLLLEPVAHQGAGPCARLQPRASPFQNPLKDSSEKQRIVGVVAELRHPTDLRPQLGQRTHVDQPGALRSFSFEA